MKFFSKASLGALLLIAGASCYRVPDQIEPKIDYAMQDHYLKSLPSPFEPLTHEEKGQPWGKEYQIAMCFAADLDLYQAL